jgi:hypothetical protein
MKEVPKINKKYHLCNGNNDPDLGTYQMIVTNKDNRSSQP